MLNLNLKKTMKKYFIYLASAAMLLATSCAKEEVNTTGETELITVQLNPETKTALGAEGTTTWDADDKVSVTVGGEVVGTLSLVEGSTFSGEITAGLNGEATLNYPAGVTAIPEPQAAVNKSFADGAALLEGTTTVEKLRAGEGVELQNKTALLQFTVAQAGDVTFEVGTAKYTVTGCKTGETYYACVAPAANVSFVARIGGYLSKKASANVTFEANKIANLEALPAPVKSNVKIKGNFTGGNDWSTEVYFFNDLNGLVLRKNVSGLNKEFKFINGQTWLGGPYAVSNKWCMTWDGDNFKLPQEKCDIYFDTNTSFFSIVDVDSSVSEYQYIYLKPNSDWKSDGARFAVAFLSSDKAITYWYSMVYNASNDVYECIVPGGYKYMIFCRMNGSTSDNNWDNRWNQTGDLVIPSDGNNYYTITGWGSGSWSKKSINR